MFRSLSAFVILTALLLPGAGAAEIQPPVAQKAVLVTGASTGIGRKVTERLASHGYFVYATARKDADLKSLGEIKNVQAVRLDVTRSDEIAAAVETITKGGRGLYALVNNAGIASVSAFLETPPEEFAANMAVNTTGPFLMTKAFAPLIVASKGRIVTIGSISGLLSSPTAGPYQMSKAAVETFTDVLAKELAPAGVAVSIVEPGGYNSDIFRNAYERTGMKSNDVDRSKLNQPDDVAIAIEAALVEPQPKRRYMVVPDERSAEVTIKAQIEKLVQINEGQPYTYDREALIKMLDAALAGSRPRQPNFEPRSSPSVNR
jgi:NAD(P)-dependent dehydrogenase (short-subunit alcohol dehydrogenase family)